MRISPLFIALSAAASLVASSASAAIMVATWSSTISHVGLPEVFGPGPKLEGTPFLMTFTYDTALSHDVLGGDGSHYTVLENGLLSASVNYEKNDFAIDLSDSSWEMAQGVDKDGRRFAYAALFADLPGMGFITTRFATSYADRAPFDLSTPFSGQIEGQGVFDFVSPGLEFGFDLSATDGRPGWLSVAPQQTGAVPEPATWALMISGFGLAGAALRRRRLLAA